MTLPPRAPASGEPPEASPWPPHQAAERALHAVEQHLATAPGEIAALLERAGLLDRLGRAEAARAAYLDVLARADGHAGALTGLGALLVAQGYASAAETVFARAVALHPDLVAARVGLGDLLRRSGRLGEARPQYEAALRTDPAQPEAHQGLSYLLEAEDPAAAARHRALGFGPRALSTAAYRGAGPPVRVLQLVSALGGNIPTRGILDDRTFLTHTLVAEHADQVAALPAHDVVLNAIGDADRCEAALLAAQRLLAGSRVPVLNPPDRVLPTARAANAVRLAGLPGVVAPRVALLSRAALLRGVPEGFAPPFLLRSPGFHTGQAFRRVDAAADLPGAVAALPGARLLALDYLDATGPDGASRKYRVMMIGGALLPLHLAVSADWKVHYFTAGMAEPAHRAEEARFLADMAGTLGPVALGALAAIAATLGLDYGGVDFGLAPDGRLLLFEANATMAIVPPPADPVWDYRRPAIAAALAAARALVRGVGSVSGK